jgi:hypothetical protein
MRTALEIRAWDSFYFARGLRLNFLPLNLVGRRRDCLMAGSDLAGWGIGWHVTVWTIEQRFGRPAGRGFGHF